MHALLANLAIATAMMALTITIHFFGLVMLLRIVSYHGRLVAPASAIVRQSLLLVIAVLGIVVLLTLEIWAYAILYIQLGALEGIEPSLYFSTVSFTSLGYGDILLSKDYRMLGAIEAANGLILFGWSTAFLISLMGKLRAIEHDWLER